MSSEREKKGKRVAHVSSMELAKIIRTQLKKNWPGRKFRVTGARSGFIYISWTDGPSGNAVGGAINAYKPPAELLKPRPIANPPYGIFIDRSLSIEAGKALDQLVAERTGRAYSCFDYEARCLRDDLLQDFDAAACS